jgi:hypothetical protein
LTSCKSNETIYATKVVDLTSTDSVNFIYNDNKAFDIYLDNEIIGLLKWNSTFSTFKDGLIEFHYDTNNILDYCFFDSSIILYPIADYKDIHFYINDVEIKAQPNVSLIHYPDVNKVLTFQKTVLIDVDKPLNCRIEGLKKFEFKNVVFSAYSFMYVFANGQTRISGAGYYAYSDNNTNNAQISIGANTENSLEIILDETGYIGSVITTLLNVKTTITDYTVLYNANNLILKKAEQIITFTYFQGVSFLIDFKLPYSFMETWYQSNNTKLILSPQQK